MCLVLKNSLIIVKVLPLSLISSTTNAFLHANHQIRTRNPFNCFKKNYMKNGYKRKHIKKKKRGVNCPSFCSERCEVLNGDFRLECSNCDTSFACNPSVWKRRTKI